MKYKALYSLLIWVLTTNSILAQQTKIVPNQSSITTDTLHLFDSARNRAVPVVLYAARNLKVQNHKIVFLNHGHGFKNTDYSYISNYLALHGYIVACIQHEIPGDEPLSTTGNLFEARKPIWERGIQNILFVIQQLKNRQLNLDYKNVILIGHSIGGDMIMLFAKEHPESISKVISLDNCRMPFPKTTKPRIFSLRSSDQHADPGVLPTLKEQERYKIHIVQLKNTVHNDMGDNGTEMQKQEINSYIIRFLEKGK